MPRKSGTKKSIQPETVAFPSAFYTDLTLPDTQYAVLVRSRFRRAKILSITPPELLPGYHFFTAEHIPGKNFLRTFGSDIPIFASAEIQYRGEPVGILVGPDRTETENLAAMTVIEVEELPPLEFTETFSTEQILAKRVILSGPSDSILAETAQTIENTYSTVPNYQNFSEPNGAIADCSQNRVEIYSPTRWPYHLRTAVSRILGIDESNIIIHQTLPGETISSNLWFPSFTAAQTALASFLIKKPVKLVFSRMEDFCYSEREAAVKIRYHTAIDPKGAILAMNVRILIDGGAYSPLIEEIIDRMVIASAGVYSIPAYRIEACALKTSYPPLGTGFDWGESQAFYGIENHIQEIARRFHFIPLELKQKNIFGPNNKMITGSGLKNTDGLTQVFTEVVKKSDYMRKYSAYNYLGKQRSNTADGPLRGIGLATAYQGGGFLGSNQSRGTYQLEAAMETDSSLTIKMNSYSPAIKQIWQKMAADILAISPELVHFDSEYAAAEGTLGPETLSSNITIMTQLLKKCCQAIQKQRFRQPLPIEVKRSYNPGKRSQWNSEAFTGMPYNAMTWGAAVIEVEIDILTFEVNIIDIWIAIDGGEIFIEKAALATLQKTVSQALSRVFGDCSYVISAGGQQKVTSNYDGLYALKIPALKISLINSGDEAKGIGEIAYNLIPGAYTAAVSQALNTVITDIPIPDSLIYSLLKRGVQEK